jgi:hypothetical protein
MPYPLFSLPQGLGWNFKQSPKFTTTIQTPQSARGIISATQQSGVIYGFELVWNYLKTSQVGSDGTTVTNSFLYLKNFYEAMQGSYGRFIFDPSLNNLATLSVTQDTTQLDNGFCGIGDGTTTVFPMWRSTSVLGGGVVTLLERIQNVSLLVGVYVDDTIVSSGSYTQSNFPGTITFETAPAENAVIAWAGNYNYLVHFDEDSIDFNEFLYRLYELKSLILESINL